MRLAYQARDILYIIGANKLEHTMCMSMWCVVCGVWCVVCGVWCVVCGVWCVVHTCGVLCVWFVCNWRIQKLTSQS